MPSSSATARTAPLADPAAVPAALRFTAARMRNALADVVAATPAALAALRDHADTLEELADTLELAGMMAR